MGNEKSLNEVNQRSQELTLEFQSHFQRFTQEHPVHADRKFAGSINKIWGIPLDNDSPL